MKRTDRRNVLAALMAACVQAHWENAGAAQDAVTLTFAGDIVLDDTVGKLIERGRDPFADFAPLLAQADIRLGNLECVVATIGSAGDKYYTFRAHPRTLDTVCRHFDAVSVANNHSGDFGRAAFSQMLGLMHSKGLGYFGGGLDQREAHSPYIVERKGLRIAILGYNEFMPRSFEAGTHSPGTAWSEDEQVVADIARARNLHGAHIVIPVMHWGWENEIVANPRQRLLARKMIDAGADAVIGGHPHVTQDIDFYRGRPIIYSVGNFVMKETDNDKQREGWLLRLFIDTNGVRAFDTHFAQIGFDGIPKHMYQVKSPSWDREAGFQQA